MMEHNGILLEEDSCWHQKAKCRWHVEGEKNTRYFHESVIDRRRRNKISQLKGEDGEWCLDQSKLRSIATFYYKDLYIPER